VNVISSFFSVGFEEPFQMNFEKQSVNPLFRTPSPKVWSLAAALRTAAVCETIKAVTRYRHRQNASIQSASNQYHLSLIDPRDKIVL